MVLRVAFLQMDTNESSLDGNRGRVGEALVEAYELGARVFALPELWSSGYDLEAATDSENGDRETLAWCRERSAEYPDLTLLAGSLLLRRDEQRDSPFVNRALMLRDGIVVSHYDKLHLFGPLREDQFLSPGQLRPTPTVTDSAVVAQTVCYDLRFPEIFRELALKGAELIHVPAQWPAARTSHWRALLIARAIESQCYVLGVNRSGSFRGGQVEFEGHSLLVGPTGEIVVDAGVQEGLNWADIATWEVERSRTQFPYLDDRRSDLYGGAGECGGAGE